MWTVNFKRVVRFLFNIFFTFPNSSFFPVQPYSFCKFQLINHRVDALNLRFHGVTAEVLSRSTSKKNSLQKFKNRKNISSLCSIFFPLFWWHEIKKSVPKKTCKTLLLSISKGLIQLACVAGGIRERAIFCDGAAFFWRGAKPRVKFPPATFLMVFACRPLLLPLITSINESIKESCNTKLEYLWFCGCTHLLQTFPSTSLSLAIYLSCMT